MSRRSVFGLALIVWIIGFITIVTGVAAALVVESDIDDGTNYHYVFLVLALFGMGIALMGVGLLLDRHRHP